MRPAIRPSPKAISNLWPTLEPFKSAKNAHFRVWYNPYYGVVVANVFKYRSGKPINDHGLWLEDQ